MGALPELSQPLALSMPGLVPVEAVSECTSMLLLQTPIFGAQYWESLVHTRCLLWRLWVTFLSITPS